MKNTPVAVIQNIISFVFLFKTATRPRNKTVYPAKVVFSAVFPVKCWIGAMKLPKTGWNGAGIKKPKRSAEYWTKPPSYI